MSTEKQAFGCPFVSIHYIICECGETFPSENDLKDHLEKEHPRKRERKEFKCGVCGFTFKTEDECINHYEDIHIDTDLKKEVPEEEPDQSKPDEAELEDNTMADEEFTYSVELEDNNEGTYEEETHEVFEEEVIHKEVVNDEVKNGVVYVDEDGDEQVLHIPEEYGQIVQEPDGRIVLLVNNKPPNKSAIVTTIPNTTKSKPIVTTIPNTTKSKPIVTTKPITIKRNAITIPVKQFALNTKLKAGNEFNKEIGQYNKIEVISTSGDVISIPRAKPGRKPSDPMTLKKKHNSTKNLKNRVCEVCGKKYASAAALKYHQRVHTGERPFHCPMCPKTFTMPLFLQIHIRTHTGERPYECDNCPKAFGNRAALLRHERVHTGVKPYPCPKCEKRFTQSNSMKLHVMTVHLKQPAPYKSKSRKLKAEETARRRKLHAIEPDPNITGIEVKTEHKEESEEEEEQVFEVVESEEINEEQNEEYTIVYK